MNKTYLSMPGPASDALTDDDLSRIGAYMRKTPEADALYTFPVVLCDHEIDRELERFDTPALEALAALFVGKTGLFDHSMQSRDQTARIFKAECIVDPARKTQTGEAYACVRATAYMPRIEKNRALIEAAHLDRDDVFQDLSIRLIRAVGSYDPDKGTLKQHIFSQLRYELRSCAAPCRPTGITDAPRDFRKSGIASLEACASVEYATEENLAA